jgi:biopolymer transport protein ExbD
MRKIRRSAKIVTEMSLASMSDIAFLLIIFFMVTSVFTLRDGLHLALPDSSKSPVIISAKNVVTITLKESGDVSWDDAPVREEAIAERLKEAHAANPRLAVLLKVSPKTRYHRSVSVIDRIKTAGITRLTLRMI